MSQDRLDFRPYAEALAFLIDWKNSKPPLTAAISAPWGTGKTTLALQVQEQLKTPGDWNDDHIMCEF
jgi:pantothenate kinase-related protein Tda10